MPRFLLFTLVGPIMAFGDVAPGERRVGVERPGRSALLGLLAAALGLRREDTRQDDLASSLAFAVRVDAAGAALVDYHTAQSVPQSVRRRRGPFATRRAELAVPAEERGTILSQRAYRTDAAFTVAALPLAEEPFAPEAIRNALCKPQLPIHAGRRACPLALPLSPRLIETADLPAAFAAYDAAEDANPDRGALRRLCRGERPPGTAIATEAVFEERGLLGSANIERREMRRDDPISRTRWQFALRADLVAQLPAPPP